MYAYTVRQSLKLYTYSAVEMFVINGNGFHCKCPWGTGKTNDFLEV